MKARCITILMCVLLFQVDVQAQFTVNDNGFFLAPETTLTVSGLSLTPSGPFSFSNNEISYSTKPIWGNPNESIKRVYAMGNPIAFKGNILISYYDNELNMNSENLLQLTKAGLVSEFLVPTNKSVVNPLENFVAEDVDWTNIKYLTLTNSGNVLPVTLIDFDASMQENEIVLSWSTSYESNSDFFEVQHSGNGKEWQTIGRVAAVQQSNEVHSYVYVHRSPLAGSNFYRLRIVDQDGTFAFSRITNAWKSQLSVVFFPNPVSDWLSIEVKGLSPIKSIRVVNPKGQSVYHTSNPQIGHYSENRVDFKNFPSGVYTINVILKDGSVSTGKISKK
ncbi:T9SS type A sorting domain-containing protein [Dyadobacter sp. LJ53]|nr:T9SS type A sorting domain-containing protein [Dyadobacter chenwenxiniae]